ncbi:jg13003 [Pararge aegeria aegeria]|uniref:Jg13003 protein n=1 Tax=Pararge aegeria aegeria TaxID=348720 RepID=A0A8S4QXC8_9NEOP|nr:jg13003 [Pararge aegeria aegeria]
MSDEAMSDCSLITVESGRLWKGPTRPRLGEFDVQLSMSSEEVMKDASSPHRGRGRPSTTGKYVAKAREALNRAKKEEMRLQVEQDLLRSIEREIGPIGIGTDDMSAGQIKKRALDEVALISSIATKSTNLKVTFGREMKNAASSIKEAVEALSPRTRKLVGGAKEVPMTEE